jgi:hypothetical protein
VAGGPEGPASERDDEKPWVAERGHATPRARARAASTPVKQPSGARTAPAPTRSPSAAMPGRDPVAER